MPSPSLADAPGAGPKSRLASRRFPVPHRRLILLLGGLAGLSVLVPMAPWLGVVWIAGALLIGLLTLTDFLFRPELSCVSARRVIQELQHVGRKSSYRLCVKNRTNSFLTLRVRDVLPPALEGDGIDETLVLEPEAEVELECAFVGLERGEQKLLPLGIRVSSPLRLLEHHRLLDLHDKLVVAPGRPAQEAVWLLSQAALMNELGERKVRRRGASREFESLRQYVVGDEVRHIDWKSSARRMKPQVRLFETERNAEVVLAFDCGRLMGSLIQGIRKMDLAMTPILDLAAVALKRRERVGFLAFDSEPRAFVPPRQGLSQLELILKSMSRLPAGATPTSYLRAVRFLETRHRKRSMVVFFTDFTDELSAQEMYRSLQALSRRHVLIFVAVGDPHLELVYERSGGSARSIFEKAVAGGLLLERRRVLAQLERLGVFTVDAEPQRLSGPLISRYLDVRLRGIL